VTIDPTTTAKTSTADVKAQKPNALGQDAFLTLLTTQLAHQDPTKPMDDTQFIAQLAQFSALEKLTTMDKSLTDIMRLLSRVGTTATAVSPTASFTSGAAPDSVTTGKGTN
jgi:flagellar basal-body rod modification protein FlgD